MSESERTVLVIRVRGQVRVRPQIEDTLDKLLLGRLHQARLLRVTPSIEGMINKAKDYITWGEPSIEVVEKLLSKRARLSGNKKLSDAYVKKNSSHSSIKALAKAIMTGKGNVSDVEGLKPVFRLTPPSKGFKGKKNLPVGMGGITGYRGEGISELALRMI
ncbi:MAG: 50S ribosomal protein L30 [Candidatus Thorarchaeota archaeon]|nr:MAG: 50S ribosomal protein L30 [Candidatus Thorarchaeota archaeon]RLI57419.1 MAG: 50S ribosomal protein L30 [Candidatus Thorarchaeota archaeon]